MFMRTLRMATILVGVMSVPVALQSAEQKSFASKLLDKSLRFGSGFFVHVLYNYGVIGAIAKVADFQLKHFLTPQLLPFHQAILIGSIGAGLFCTSCSSRPESKKSDDASFFERVERYMTAIPYINTAVPVGGLVSCITIPINLNFMRCFLPLIR